MAAPAPAAAADGPENPAVATEPRPRVRIVDSMRELNADLQQLEDLGLSLDPLSAASCDDIEHTLITDSWSCAVCGTSTSATCPVTGKPHRRRLVAIAQHAVRLIERHVGRVYVRPAPLSRRVEGEVQVRTQRRLTINPHTFLLAFYFAAQAPHDDTPPSPPSPAARAAAAIASTEEPSPRANRASTAMVAECARHLLDVVREIKSYGAAPTDDAYCHTLLKSVRRAWRQYARQVKGELAAGGGVDLPRTADTKTDAALAAPLNAAEARDELVSCTKQALIEAVEHSRKEPSNLNLKRFTALLYQRLSRLCTAAEFAEVRSRVEQLEGGDSTPRISYAGPPVVLSDANTTASEDESANALTLSTSAAQRRAGPELPPGWYVDERGISRPPADHEERKRRERYLQREFKAQKAYEAVMEIQAEAGRPAQVQAEVAAALSQAELQQLAVELNHTPPRLQRLARLLSLVEDRFIEALPPRLRPRLRQEFHDVLDWNIIQRQARGSAGNIAGLVRFVGEKVIECSSQAREAATAARMAAVCDDIEHCAPDVGTAVASAFAFLFEAIRELREDVAKFSLVMINATLKQNAVQYIRDFIAACLPVPRRWAGSIAFVQRFVNDARVQMWATTSVPQAWTSITAEERRMRGALLVGTLDLLRSGRHTSLDRWVDLPPEVFYFEKHVIFKAANTVQECTLLLLLDGAISSVLARRAVKAATVTDLIRRLHHQILSLLSEDIRLNALKESVLDSIESELYRLHVGDGEHDAAALAALAPQVTLTEPERQTVRSTIDKMTNTEDPLYVTFERRVLQFLETMLVQNTDDSPPLGLVTDTLKQQVRVLRHMLSFHWEVYAPSYREMLPLLAIESAPAST